MGSIKNLFYVFTDKRLFIEWILQILRDITLYFIRLAAKLDIDGYYVDQYSIKNKEIDMRNMPQNLKQYTIYDQEILKMRWDICKGCEFLTDSNKCTKCGCYMKVKHKLAPAKCPIGKWEAYKKKETYGITNIK